MGIFSFFLLLVSPSLSDIVCGGGRVFISGCVSCPAGSYCLSTDLSGKKNLCPPSTYNPNTGGANISACLNCTLPFYSITSGATACTFCPLGTFVTRVSGNSFKCNSCPANTFSSEISSSNSTCLPCPTPLVSGPGAAQCLCPAGSYNSSSPPFECLPCPGGTYGFSMGLQTPECSGLCIKGYFCPPGSTKQYWCPAGVYGSTPGLANSSCSGICPAGTFGSPDPTPLRTKDTPACSGPCQMGYYCPPGSTNSTPYKCPAGTMDHHSASPICRAVDRALQAPMVP